MRLSEPLRVRSGGLASRYAARPGRLTGCVRTTRMRQQTGRPCAGCAPLDGRDTRLTWRQISLHKALGAYRAWLNPNMRRQTAQRAAGAAVKTRAVCAQGRPSRLARAMADAWCERPGSAPGARAAGLRSTIVNVARGRAGGQDWRRGISSGGDAGLL